MANLDRPLGHPSQPPPPGGRRRGAHGRSVFRKVAVVFAVLFAVGFIVSRLDFSRSYGSLRSIGVLSGSREGNYFAVVDELGKIAVTGNGSLRNVESAGSQDNVARLVAASKSGGGGQCDVAFALVQDGADWSASDKVELIARLPKAESVFFLGVDADKITELSQLAGKTIGVGPSKSGPERLAKQLFDLPELRGLGVRLVNQPLGEQLAAAKKGELDLALLVIDEDAPMVVSAVRDMELQIASFSHIDVISRRLPHFRTGRIGAGQFEAVKVLPAQDKRVLRVETVVVGNRCASRSATIDMLNVLSRRFPDLVRFNKDTPNATGLDWSVTAKGFYEHGGPELADEYVPWLVDVMPPANWAYIVMGVSILFNAMGAGHRFRLWRIDDARVKLEGELGHLFGTGVTLGDIARTKPQGNLTAEQVRDAVTHLVAELEQLAARSRRQSLSVLVPMGQEMAYRYQEEIIYQTMAVLREYLRQAGAAA